MNGNAGDDTLVWNNGDGNDQMNGDDGLDKIENNLGAANDVSALSVLNGKVRYARTNNPFTLDVASSEVFELNTFGGDDTLTTGPGLGALIAVVADAGSGNDTFTGGDESTTYFGGLGNDTLDPGPGIGDAVDGQDGDDNLKVRDSAADLARGGAGMDSATADFEDVLVDVENKDVTAGPDTTGTAARVRSRRITSKLKKGVYTAKIRIQCPASEAGGCSKGILALQTARKVSLGGTRFNALREGAALLAEVRADQDPQGQAAQGRPRAQPPRHAVPERDHDEPRRGGQPRPALVEALDQAGPLSGL